ncbi:ankyrin repeat-containing protein BDA1-like [Mercurialis annua]|uniref:ankyrin repeat-containing protein BDA1-like n=1 Tax=Mercurialis annua TaxID=3986 RepID=UPI00215FBFE3|nr:ankyrin repeat-containing protein BDA1-like [Mercurialis annua]
MNPLMEASHAGDTDGLYAATRENPNIFAEIDEIPFADTPLHASASKGHIPYSMEIMKLMPLFATKLNTDGFSPIHLALQNEHIQLAIRLVEKNNDLVRVKGREDITPLHYAVEKGNVELMARFLFVSPKSVEDVNVRNETALHIALRYEMFEAFEFLVGRLQLSYHEEACYLEKKILNWIDAEGNTILHIATFKKQLQLVRLLINCKVDINAKNVEGRTALDYVQDDNTIEIKDLLCSAGAVGGSSIPIIDYSALLLR